MHLLLSFPICCCVSCLLFGVAKLRNPWTCYYSKNPWPACSYQALAVLCHFPLLLPLWSLIFFYFLREREREKFTNRVCDSLIGVSWYMFAFFPHSITLQETARRHCPHVIHWWGSTDDVDVFWPLYVPMLPRLTVERFWFTVIHHWHETKTFGVRFSPVKISLYLPFCCSLAESRFV